MLQHGDFWFLLYHNYFPNSPKIDPSICFGFEKFSQDLDLAQQCGVQNVMIEDYWQGPRWADYTHYASFPTLKKIVAEIHNRSMRFFPYFCLTEADELSYAYQNITEARTFSRQKRPYPGFMNYLLPYYNEFDFRTFVMCTSIKSKWPQYLCSLIIQVIQDTEADGIYLDRADYRLRCWNADHGCTGKNEFIQGLVNLTREIKQIAKRVIGEKGEVCINDSCIIPDRISAGCMQHADMILSEVLPIDTNPNNPVQQLYPYVAPIGWKLRHFIKPVLKKIIVNSLSGQRSASAARMKSIFNRIHQIVPEKPVYFFQHGEGTSHISRVIQSMNLTKKIGAKNALFFGRARFPQLFTLK